MARVNELALRVGLGAACQALGLWRGAPARQRIRAHRAAMVGPVCPRPSRPVPPLALNAQERGTLLVTLNSERFLDSAPATVYAVLLDKGRYLGSVRTMYRHLAGLGGSTERRNQRIHPAYAKPELLATGPNQVWTWDISKLKGPAKWTCFHLYVILDIYSRYVVGWMIAARECSELAKQLIARTVALHGLTPGTLTLHADRGSSMRSKTVAEPLVDLNITKSHSRPHVSDDNPYSEAQFKTLKYQPQFPARFGCLEDARAYCRTFFHWYNEQHRHSGIGFMTPNSVHNGRAAGLQIARQRVLDSAFGAHPERFKASSTPNRTRQCSPAPPGSTLRKCTPPPI